jgi:hypothetical protein
MISPRKLIKRAMKTGYPTAHAFGSLTGELCVHNQELAELLNTLFLIYLKDTYRFRQSSYLDFIRRIEQRIAHTKTGGTRR